MDCCHKYYPDHSKEIVKINRLIGQLEGIKKMIVNQRYCIDILNQIKAVSGALGGCEARILKTHLHSCFLESLNSSNKGTTDEKIEEIITLFKKY